MQVSYQVQLLGRLQVQVSLLWRPLVFVPLVLTFATEGYFPFDWPVGGFLTLYLFYAVLSFFFSALVWLLLTVAMPRTFHRPGQALTAVMDDRGITECGRVTRTLGWDGLRSVRCRRNYLLLWGGRSAVLLCRGEIGPQAFEAAKLYISERTQVKYR